MQLSMIVATDMEGGIGKNNSLPWNNIPEDMKLFKDKTQGKPCIMGRNTFESIVKALGKPLPNRLNIVLTQYAHKLDMNNEYTNVCYAKDAYEALQAAQYHYDGNPDETGVEDVMVIGGGQVYELLLPFVETVYQTQINKTFDCDVNIKGTLAKIYEQFDMNVVDSFYNEATDCNVMFIRGSREIPADIRDIIKAM